MNRVVITGLGPVFAMGQGKEAFFEHLLHAEPIVKALSTGYCKQPLLSKWYVPYPKIDVGDYDRAIQRLFLMAPKNAAVSVVSVAKALQDAKIEQPDPEACVFWGVGAPNMTEIHQGFQSLDAEKPLHPCLNPMMMPSSSSAWIAIAFGLHGANQVCATACASGTTAIGMAYQYLKNGSAKMAICGGADCFCGDDGLVLKSFEVLGAVSASEDGLPRPFSKGRSGFLFSEGGACGLILETYESAKERGADIYAEITGYESCCDGYHIVQMPKEPKESIKMMQKLVGKDDIDYYNAHGTGTVVNDQNEALLIRTVFGENNSLLINSTKGIIGHTIGASGAVEAAVCAYAIKHQIVHRNITSDPIAGLHLPLENVEMDVHTAISASFGFGGNNAALKFQKVGK